MKNRKICLLIFVLFFSKVSFSQDDPLIINYINTYKDIAISEMKRTGVPAAIKLAQGIHETEAGTSKLVMKSNNHFGIKCKSDWRGMSVSHTDDAPNECFRKYNESIDSYKDHSDFLRKSTRYASLFSLDPTDYSGWANGLKKAGYATNSKYPQIIIKLIEDYHLQDYSLIALGKLNPTQEILVKEEQKKPSTTLADKILDTADSEKPVEMDPEPEIIIEVKKPAKKNNAEQPTAIKEERKKVEQPSLVKEDKSKTELPALVKELKNKEEKSSLIKEEKDKTEQPILVKAEKSKAELPAFGKEIKSKEEQPPLVNAVKIKTEIPTLANQEKTKAEQPILVEVQKTKTEPLPTYPDGEFKINETRVIYIKKGTPFLLIAEKHAVPLARIFDFNDMKEQEVADKDQLIYLMRKRKTGNNEQHIILAGETLFDIAQKEAIRIESLLEYNYLTEGMKPVPGTVLYLRSKAPTMPLLISGK